MANSLEAIIKTTASGSVVPSACEEELLKQYIEATPVGILMIDSEGQILYVNESLCTCFGYSREELLGQQIELLVPESIKGDHAKLRDSYLANPMPRLMQGRRVRGRRKNGTEVAVAIGFNPVAQAEGANVACTVMDITETLRSEDTWASFFDLSLDLFCVANTQGFFLRVNPNFSRQLGYSEEELVRRPFFDFVHPEDVAATQEALAVLASGHPVVRFRNRYLTARGATLWLEWNARAATAEGIIYAVGRDVTDEVRFQNELQAREQRETAILENTPAVVYLKDIDGKYLYVNQQYIDLFSIELGTILGKTDYQIFPTVLAERFRKNDRQVIETRSKVTTKEIAAHKDGLHTYVSVKFPLFDAQGQVAAVAGISTDITEDLKKQKIEEELKLAITFQQKLYPPSAPSIPGLDISGSALPASQMCGDYYDFILTDHGRIVIAVGDVSGHGLGPALAMVEARSIIRGMLHGGSNVKLSDVLRDLNEYLLQDLPEESFLSLFLTEIDVARHRLSYAAAGHEAVLFPANRPFQMLRSTAPVLGLFDAFTVEELPAVALDEGDALLICTDGVTEAQNAQGELFSIERAAEVIEAHRGAGSAEILKRLFSQTLEFTGGQAIKDDMTAVVAKA